MVYSTVVVESKDDTGGGNGGRGARGLRGGITLKFWDSTMDMPKGDESAAIKRGGDATEMEGLGFLYCICTRTA
jgi:hypothetical protein